MKINLPGILSFEKLKKEYAGTEVISVLEKNRAAIDEISNSMLRVIQKKIIENPAVYIARTKDTKTEIEYFVAKTFFPISVDKTKEVKIYLGRADLFNNDTTDKAAFNFARHKMSITLQRRLEDGSL